MSKTQFKYPADGLFRYRVGLVVAQDGQQTEQEFSCRWSPSKVDSVEIGQACAAQINALGKTKVMPLSCERVA